MREKLYIEYLLCLSYKQAIAWMKAGHELWQEDSSDYPNCGGFDTIECFDENFPDKEIDKTDNIHLVPSIPEKTSNPVNDYIEAEQLPTDEHLKKYNVTVELKDWPEFEFMKDSVIDFMEDLPVEVYEHLYEKAIDNNKKEELIKYLLNFGE